LIGKNEQLIGKSEQLNVGDPLFIACQIRDFSTQEPKMSLTQWADNGWLRSHSSSAEEIANFLAIVNRKKITF